MRRRPSSRLLVIDPDGRVLLFHFVFTSGARAGDACWATPGGAVEPGETFAEAACRELHEETGIVIHDAGEHVAEREFVLQLPDGERVMAEERFYVVRSAGCALSTQGWTAWERQVMADHHWWSIDELRAADEVVFPEDLVSILARVSAGARQ